MTASLQRPSPSDSSGEAANEIAYGAVSVGTSTSPDEHDCRRMLFSQITGLRATLSIWSSRGSRRIRARWGGVPCLRGLRIPVATVVALVAEGQTTEAIVALYPDLEADDVREALLFAAEAVRERALPLAAGE